MTDPALTFWLRHVAAEGGLSEPAGDSTFVVLPPALRDAYSLPEELQVTADPDVAREDGATLLALGHPVLAEAAERVLASGDSGLLVLARPVSAPPSRDVLLAAVRDAFPVDHGRIDLAGEPTFVRHPVIRVGALVTYEVSAEDHFQEQAERWVDGPGRRLLPPDLTERLSRAATSERGGPGLPDGGFPSGSLLAAIGEAHRLIDAAAAARRETLTGQVRGAHDAEHDRAAAYYADAIAGIERRLAAAPADRKAVLEQRLRSTREEESRRLAEIAEKYEAHHVIRPYRLHVLDVPALRVPADVRRGDRRYPVTFDWLLPAGAFAPVRCPSCGGDAPLVAGKQKLGCETCLPPKLEPSASLAPSPAAKASPPAAAAPAGAKAPPVAGEPPPVAKSPRPASVPPAARRRSPVPPHVRKEQRKAPGKLAERLWSAVAAGRAGNASAVLEPGSPAAVLYRVFGASGLTRVIGMPAGEAPVRFTAQPADGTSGGDVIAGVLIGDEGTERAYYLSCHDRQVAEVLPCAVTAGGEFWNTYWWWQRRAAAAGWLSGQIPSRSGLDPVGKALLSVGAGWNGLPVAARALAAWARISGEHQRVMAGRHSLVVAAAVDRLVAHRAGGRATFADAAAVYKADEQAIRQADRPVRALLALGPDQPW
ncbi:MAG TPA: hypothetical protein VE733_03375 [Streptosporangiaceae bacterium]|nr:hypothetical protein [Streptosporangiaceae bacterium]